MVTAMCAGCGIGRGITSLSGEYGRVCFFHGIHREVLAQFFKEAIPGLDSLKKKRSI